MIDERIEEAYPMFQLRMIDKVNELMRERMELYRAEVQGIQADLEDQISFLRKHQQDQENRLSEEAKRREGED